MKPAKATLREAFYITVWEERDRLSIVAYCKPVRFNVNDRTYSALDLPGDEVAEWWDEDARSMFEDGFFEREPKLEDSVFDYLVSCGVLLDRG